MAEKITQMSAAQAAKDYQCLFGANKNLYRVEPLMQDGLKPGMRRAFVSMWWMDNKPTNPSKCKFYKAGILSSRTMEIHPHADNEDFFSYQAQKFSNNAPTMINAGSVGNMRAEKPAAGRYLSLKMSPYAIDCFFSEFDKSCVPTRYTYDDATKEPEFLPAKYPHALINPQFSSIGYTEASNIPSFNITELFNATISLIKNPDAKIMLIPDFPTGCDILDEGLFKAINKTGLGKVTQRATYSIDYQKNIIRITSLPLQTNSDRVIKNIIDIKSKSRILDDVIDIKDSTQKENVDFTIHLKPDANPEKVLKLLFKKSTDLKKTFPVQIKLIDDFKSHDYGVKEFLLEWIEYRRDIVRAMFNKSWQLAEEKIQNNDAIIMMFNGNNAEITLDICRTSRSKKEIIERLVKQYKVTSIQANAIAEMRMYNHSKEWIETFKKDNEELKKELIRILEYIDDDSKIDEYICDQLKDGIKKYGGPRKCKVIKEVKVDENQIPDTNHLVGITESGYIKKVSSDNVTIGVVGTTNDNLTVVEINNREDLLIIDSTGQVSKIPVSAIPDMKFEDTGIEINRYFKTTGKVIKIMKMPSIDILKDKDNNISIVVVTKLGIAKRVALSEFKKLEAPKPCITLEDNDEVVSVMFIYKDTNNDIIIYTNEGNGIRLNISDIKVTGKASKGTRMLVLKDSEYVVSASKIIPEKKRLFYITSSGRVKVTEIKYFPVMQRKDDVITLISLEGKETLVGVASVNKNDKVMVYRKVGEPELIDVSTIEVGSRVSKGTKMIKTPKGDSVIAYKVFTNK